ncbi:MAG: tryptophan synthase subunit alpha [Pseudomonadales bacterium]|jgi:tryptophan synthase alpha chain|nr:tryptophan synthase subunit alpha [Pseudomonadales bacterium]MDP7358494.1 tryptophan synthase subunit alpha [Pseudomonadales bacterium]MDP7595081.1 tryptophan synthase subunit alpha [Pseudomonadales bacterium]HJN51283.1 tryptophan synthase subunit alpha [Pseudomonadales bacterium]|tara:strand:+ start:579 stop:1397 length:819 start_codon:yes stop_codon:yes gene_type:complete
MSRIAECFSRLKQGKRKALVVFVTAGDPTRLVTVPLMHAMVAAGADIIELGVPFSDPEAEGPVIQAACERALADATSLSDVIAMVADFRKEDGRTPVILMGYLNPIEVMGYAKFSEAAGTAGVDGIITVNLPPEEADSLSGALRGSGVDCVYLLAPTTTLKRARKICAASSGFVYYVSLKGVTGAATLDVESVARKLESFYSVSDLPIAVGFGIKDGPSAAAVARLADGVVVGSSLVEIVAGHRDQPDIIPDKVSRLVKSMRVAIDAAGQST